MEAVVAGVVASAAVGSVAVVEVDLEAVAAAASAAVDLVAAVGVDLVAGVASGEAGAAAAPKNCRHSFIV